MRHAIEQIARRNNAEMEATFTLMRHAAPSNLAHPTLTEYERGQLFGRYERMLSLHNKLKEALSEPPERIRYNSGPIDRAARIK